MSWTLFTSVGHVLCFPIHKLTCFQPIYPAIFREKHRATLSWSFLFCVLLIVGRAEEYKYLMWRVETVSWSLEGESTDYAVYTLNITFNTLWLRGGGMVPPPCGVVWSVLNLCFFRMVGSGYQIIQIVRIPMNIRWSDPDPQPWIPLSFLQLQTISNSLVYVKC